MIKNKEGLSRTAHKKQRHMCFKQYKAGMITKEEYFHKLKKLGSFRPSP